MIVLPLILAAVFVAQAIYLNSDPGDYLDAVAAFSHLAGTTGVTSAAFVLSMTGSITTRLRGRSSAGVLLRGIGHVLQHRGRRGLRGVSSSIYYELLPHATPLGIAAVAHVVSQPIGPYVDLASLYFQDSGSAMSSYGSVRGWDLAYLPWSTGQSDLKALIAFLDSPIRNDTCLPARRPEVTTMTCQCLCSDAPFDQNDLSSDPSYSSIFLEDSPVIWKLPTIWLNVYVLCRLIIISVMAIVFLFAITFVQLAFPSDPDWLKLPVLLPSSLPTRWMVLVELVKEDSEEPGIWTLIPKPSTSSPWTAIGVMSEDRLEDDSFTLEFELSLFAVENRLLVASSDEESHPDNDLESLYNGSDGTRGDDESDFGACPIYASDCGGFPDSSSDMSLDSDSEDLDCVDVEYDNGRTTLDLEQWKFMFIFGLSKISGVDEPHRPKVSRSSVERFSGRFIYGLAAETCGSNSNVAIPSSKRRRLVRQVSEVGQ